jgi:DNA mismatch repair protein MutL
MPPELVDVNVHPPKLEVRFQDSGRLYSQLLATLRGKFLTTDLSTRVPVAGSGDPTGGHDDARATQLRQQVVDWAKGKVSAWHVSGTDTASATTAGPLGATPIPAPHAPLELTRLSRAGSPTREATGPEPVARSAPDGAGADRAARPSVPALQVHNRYLVAETEEGVTIIDQHALHERILYEQLRSRIAAGAVETQNLLVPEPVDLGAAEATAALEHRDLLAELGMRIEPFGGETVLIVGFPAMLANMNPVEVLRDLLGRLLAGGKQPDRRDLLDDLLHTIACKAAIKAGDRLAPEEIAIILEQRHLVVDSHHCPHGRPAALVFTREELDKRFKRV